MSGVPPIDLVENKQIVSFKKLFNKHFYRFYLDWENPDYTYYIHKGGRNSAKSSHISMLVVKDVMKHPITALVGKRWGNSLEKTVIPQIKWAMRKLGVFHLFRENKTNKTLTYIPRGNKIAFVGMDDPSRIKGLKEDEFPVALFWVDELAQVKTEDELSNIENSILRDELPNGLRYKMVYSYNPPRRKHNWCNKKYESKTLPLENPEYRIYHSTYKENPHVTREMIKKAELVKKMNPRQYDHEYMGLPIGNGLSPFENITPRKIEDYEIACFDNVSVGIDWGFGGDPLHLSMVHYDKKYKRLYVFGEKRAHEMFAREIGEWILKKGYNIYPIIAGSDRPQDCSLLRKDFRLKVKNSSRYQGVKPYRESWLNDLQEIIIDYSRCPKTWEEFENIDYEVDKEGNALDRLEDKNDHSIESVAYACDRFMHDKIRGLKGAVYSV